MARGHLDGLADYVTTEVLKEGRKNCKGWDFGVRNLSELPKVYR